MPVEAPTDPKAELGRRRERGHNEGLGTGKGLKRVRGETADSAVGTTPTHRHQRALVRGRVARRHL